MTLRGALAGLGLLVAGCAKSAPPAVPAPPPYPQGYVPAAKSGPECESIRARTALWPAKDTIGLQQPVVWTDIVPPAPPDGLRHVVMRVDMRVSEQGKIIGDSIRVTGMDDPAYLRDLRQNLVGYQLWPAVLEGCAVSLRTVIQVGPFIRDR